MTSPVHLASEDSLANTIQSTKASLELALLVLPQLPPHKLQPRLRLPRSA